MTTPHSVPLSSPSLGVHRPLARVAEAIDPFEFVRTIAAVPITRARPLVRLSAARALMDEALQALCLLAGANPVSYGDRLLTTASPQAARDRAAA